ncbi:MAG: ribosome silencing factor [Deltaproteobacteria bacterium]|nr:ribosome silencing factor [Deltaproteobacteria bacterium]
MTSDFDLSIEPYIRATLGKKAIGLAVLDVRNLTSIADALIICSGRSNRQVTAIGEHIKQKLKEKGIKPLSVEGMKEGRWVLLDYGHIIIHIFYEPVRSFYDLDGLWIDAKKIKTAFYSESLHNTKSPEAESLNEQ